MQNTTNQSGQITIDFLFALGISFGLFLVFFALTYTFSALEVAQYVAFSAARAHAAGNISTADQVLAATAKINQLTKSDPAISTLFNTGWFTFGKNPQIRSGFGLATNPGIFTQLQGLRPAAYINVFTGVSIPFESQLLGFRVPFISNSSAPQEDDSGAVPFSTNVNAIILREPSMDECQLFWSQRARQMNTLKFPSAAFQGIQLISYYPTEDNGC